MGFGSGRSHRADRPGVAGGCDPGRMMLDRP
jgi:hypothetical protein